MPMMTKLRICTCSRDVSKEGNMRRLQTVFRLSGVNIRNQI